MHNTKMSFHIKINHHCERILFEEILFPPFGSFWAGILYKKHFTKYRAPYFNKRLMFGIATKTKITRGKPTWKFFLLLDSEGFIGYRAEKKSKTSRRTPKKPKKPKKTKSWEKCCGFLEGIVFFCFLLASCFFWFLWFFLFLWFFGFLRVSLVFRLRSFHRLQG